MARNVVLVGFSGVGKTTIGRALAAHLGMEFVDLDTSIEEKYHATIPHIFEQYGESVFRQCEYQTLTEKLALSGQLIATGGGAPTYKDAMEQINTHALSIFLNLTELALVERLKHSKKKRPLTDNLSDEALKDYVHQTLQGRLPFYKMAHVQVNEENINIEEVAKKISDLL